jgi:protein gp37
MAKRLKAMGSANYENGFKLTLHEHVLELPLTWKKPQTIFVNSMSDLFHLSAARQDKNVPLEFIQKMFDVMNKACWHKFQILTKRSERLFELAPLLTWTDNIWMGVSIENQNYTNRIDHLRYTNAKVRFLSIEPLIGPIEQLDLTNINWVIVGGESGPGARPMREEWVITIRDECKQAKVPFFFKQWGGINKKKTGRLLEGKTWDEVPKLRKVG